MSETPKQKNYLCQENDCLALRNEREHLLKGIAELKNQLQACRQTADINEKWLNTIIDELRTAVPSE